jgi:hypothetical protein
MSPVVKMKRTKTGTLANGQASYTYRVYIPNETVDALGLKDGDYVAIAKPDWTDFLNWKEMGTTWNALPQDARKKLEAKGIKGPD